MESITARADDGLVATLSDGPELIFGDSSRARSKWIAAARVLADPEAEGATYIDLRQPDRPAAGGLPTSTVTPVAPAGAAAFGAQAAPAASAAALAGQTPADPTAVPPAAATAPAPGVTPGAPTPDSTAPPPTQAGGVGAPPG